MTSHYPFVLLLSALALPAHAEPAVQVLEYQSAFEGYQAYSDSEIQNWPKANELVEEIGGWRVYAREPYEDKAKEQPTSAKEPVKPKTHNHGGEQ